MWKVRTMGEYYNVIIEYCFIYEGYRSRNQYFIPHDDVSDDDYYGMAISRSTINSDTQ